MKINTQESNIQTSGNMRTKTFAMKASAKGFRIISQTLYKDPILAIVRELVCNGWDGHQMNNNQDRKIDVHIPNQLEPWFAVRDYGVGMHDDDIFGVYTTVFDSTKDQSNDVIGAMGLGSKTPFAYNGGQAFVVTSIHKGKKAVYSAYLNGGMPDITCLQEPIDTVEPDGVEVKVPVAREDYGKFKAAANKCLWSFDAPAVHCNEVIERPQRFVEKEEYLVAGLHHNSHTKIHAMMGNIVYPISQNNVDSEKYRALARLLPEGYRNNQNVVIKFDIGEVDISASREELHYDDPTIKAINKRLDIVLGMFVKDAQEYLDKQGYKTVREAYHTMKEKYVAGLVDRLKYGKETIYEWRDSFDSSLDEIYINGTVVTYNQNGSRKTCTSHGERRLGDHIRSSWPLHKKPKIVIEDDLKTGGVGIARTYATREHKQVYYYHKDKPSTHGVLKFYQKLDKSEYIVLKTSALTEYKPDSTSTASSGPKKKPVPIFTIDEHANLNKATVDANALLTDEIIYVPFYREYVENGHGRPLVSVVWSNNYRESQCVVRDIMNVLFPGKTLYAARRSELGKLEKNPNAIKLTDEKYIHKYLKTVDVKPIGHAMAYYKAQSKYRHQWLLRNDKYCELLGIPPIGLSAYDGDRIQFLNKYDSTFRDRVELECENVYKQSKAFYNSIPLLQLFTADTKAELFDELMTLINQKGTK